MSNLRWAFQRWITPAWYKYLLEKPYHDTLTLRMIWCRIKGHPYPVGWYTAGQLEPDMTCTNCGEDLG